MRNPIALFLLVALLAGCSKSGDSASVPQGTSGSGAGVVLSEARAKATLDECVKIAMAEVKGSSYEITSFGPITAGEGKELVAVYEAKGKELGGPVDVRSRATFVTDQAGKFYLKSTGQMSFCDDRSPLAVN